MVDKHSTKMEVVHKSASSMCDRDEQIPIKPYNSGSALGLLSKSVSQPVIKPYNSPEAR